MSEATTDDAKDLIRHLAGALARIAGGHTNLGYALSVDDMRKIASDCLRAAGSSYGLKAIGVDE